MAANPYLERVRSRRNRRRWSRRATTAAWLLAVIALIGLWRLFPDLSSQSSATQPNLDDVEISDIPIGTNAADEWTAAEVIDDWSLPLPRVDHGRAGRPHHDYPAWDYGVAVGTEVYALTSGRIVAAIDDDRARCGGTVTIRTDDDADITYCHLSAVFVEHNDRVDPGDFVGLTGGEPGEPGAGNTRGPHLHLQIRHDGELRCPQDQLLALLDGSPVPISELSTSGCISGQSLRAGIAAPEAEADDFFEWD